MKRLLILIVACIVSACAFSSEAPLFSGREAALPIRDGAQFAWIEGENRSEQRSLMFRREGRGYVVVPVGRGEDKPMHAMFVAIRGTREEDYVVQTQFDDDAVAYAFLWRRGDGYRMIVNLGAFGDKTPDVAGLCEPKSYGECAFTSREAIVRFYRAYVLPAFVRGGAAPAEYMELQPENEAARRGRR
ncbi:MAG: hypothetical protein JNJ73_18775 [Hyphomonadaceae bacterium]|nr:hypothetical protein [Hyphomonadaceae bacterium]